MTIHCKISKENMDENEEILERRDEKTVKIKRKTRRRLYEKLNERKSVLKLFFRIECFFLAEQSGKVSFYCADL